MIYVPLGSKTAGHILGKVDEVRGGSSWGAGTFAGSDGSRMPSERELELAEIQGEGFWRAVERVRFE
jgi:NAD(P)H dehydrogenase (quinone)